MAPSWVSQRERGSRFSLLILKWVALGLGRRAVQCVLVFVVSYFMVFVRQSRQASKGYLRRVYKREPTWREVWMHFFTFAVVSVDRLYFLSDRNKSFKVNFYGEAIFEKFMANNQGCILMVSHVGSFDVMRGPAVRCFKLPIRVLMDKQHNAKAMALLQALSPELASQVLDARLSAPELSLTLDQCLKRGEFVGIMGDRSGEGDRATLTKFLGDDAAFPTGPWLLSMVLKVPVILCVGLYRGAGQYDVHFELIDMHINKPRRLRNEALSEVVSHYARRIEHYVGIAPYNWFNFYEFWSDGTSSNK